MRARSAPASSVSPLDGTKCQRADVVENVVWISPRSKRNIGKVEPWHSYSGEMLLHPSISDINVATRHLSVKAERDVTGF